MGIIIFKASYKGYSELVSLLIHFGLDAAKQDKHGQTALHIGKYYLKAMY